MKKYFMELVKTSRRNVLPNEINEFKIKLIAELEKLGASKNEVGLVSDEMIKNAIINNRKIDDIAWAILQ